MSAFTHGVKVVFAVGLFASALVACDDSTTGTGGSTSSTTGSKGTTTSTTKSSSGSMSSGTGGGPVCGLIIDEREDCQACVDGSCCAELQDCDPTGTTDCGKLTACLIACAEGNVACQEACITADETASMGAGLTAFQLIFTCFDDNCAADPACVYPICDSGLVLQDQACAECLTDSCCAPIKACAANMACTGCLTSMDPPSGGEPCGTAGSAEDMLYQAQDMCETNSCKNSCTFTICGSELGYNLPSCNACLTDNCCASYNPCLADMACMTCLGDPDGAGCAANALFTAFTTCRDTDGPTTCGDAGECNFE